MTKNDLTELARTLAQSDGVTLSTVSMRVAKNGNFFKRLEDGGGCTLATYRKHSQWFSDHWPEGLAWPVDIPRPEPRKLTTTKEVA